MEVCAVFVVFPSPKFQSRLVMGPVEVSVKVTASGVFPETGLALNETVTGGS